MDPRSQGYDSARVTPATRASMQANRRRDTGPELKVRSLLHAAGLRYRVDHVIRTPTLVARADIAFPRARLAIFIDGCYWHSCPDHGEIPATNRSYWEAKFKRNAERDLLVDEGLMRAGWRVLRIWEHVPPNDAAREVEAALQDKGQVAVVRDDTRGWST
jgi:DNA mismatch endonuclease (patch repair protein)